MRSDRIATWTSGEPVSLALVAYSLMSSLLRSAVIDIGHILSKTRMVAAPAGMSSRWGREALRERRGPLFRLESATKLDPWPVRRLERNVDQPGGRRRKWQGRGAGWRCYSANRVTTPEFIGLAVPRPAAWRQRPGRAPSTESGTATPPHPHAPSGP